MKYFAQLIVISFLFVLSCNNGVQPDSIAQQILGTWTEASPQADRYRIIFNRDGSFNLVTVQDGAVATSNGAYTLLTVNTIGLCLRISDVIRDCSTTPVGPYSLADGVLSLGPIRDLTVDPPVVVISERAQFVKQ